METWYKPLYLMLGERADSGDSAGASKCDLQQAYGVCRLAVGHGPLIVRLGFAPPNNVTRCHEGSDGAAMV